ncbi:MAG: hypothetical protein ACC653_02545 [Gammaproteobacteria bacterium]
METLRYENKKNRVAWKGVSLEDGDAFRDFMQNKVASRLRDEEGSDDFEANLRSLAGTGFATENLNNILNAEIPETRNWATGEALAEAWLAKEHNIIWPWNMERDKRTPKASLPGADLVGFITENGQTQLVIGEVKTSSDSSSPPNVMYGRSGMTHQLDTIATNLAILNQLLKWLWPRCKGSEFENIYKSAVTLLLNSGNNTVYLFGVLIRDVEPDENDLKSRGEYLSTKLQKPTNSLLIALYLPCEISNLTTRITGGSST